MALAVAARASPVTVLTIGHGRRAIEELIGVARAHGVHRIVDVRRYPASRMNPQFGRDALARALDEAGIEYFFEGDALGGRRVPSATSRNTALRSAPFRGYADHMETEEFGAGVDRVLALAAAAPTAVMCAETVPWRCHRFILSDALLARGARVVHLIDEKPGRPHALSESARIEGTRVVYDGRAPGEAELPFPES